MPRRLHFFSEVNNQVRIDPANNRDCLRGDGNYARNTFSWLVSTEKTKATRVFAHSNGYDPGGATIDRFPNYPQQGCPFRRTHPGKTQIRPPQIGRETSAFHLHLIRAGFISSRGRAAKFKTHAAGEGRVMVRDRLDGTN